MKNIKNMNFHIITIFPGAFKSYFGESIIKRALEAKKIAVNCYDLRDWAGNRHKTVDDKPYGGGAGMVMMAEPIFKAVNEIKGKIPEKARVRVALFSAKGKRYTQKETKRLAKYEHIIMICGRYEGIDERVARNLADEEVSIGDFVVTGGEIPAMVLVDSITRLLPGVLGNKESLSCESHAEKGRLEYPQYTRPEVFEFGGKKMKVPGILLSGDHGKIEKWKAERMKKA